MSKQTSALERIELLIAMGEQVLSTHRPPPRNVISAFTLDEGAFTEWRTRALSALEQFFGSTNVYTLNFQQNVEYNTQVDVQRGLGIPGRQGRSYSSLSFRQQCPGPPSAHRAHL